MLAVISDLWPSSAFLVGVGARPSASDVSSFPFSLSRLSVKGDNIVIMSIHQPRYSIFKLFDSLTLLSLGNVVYHGQASNALEYFHNAGIYI